MKPLKQLGSGYTQTASPTPLLFGVVWMGETMRGSIQSPVADIGHSSSYFPLLYTLKMRIFRWLGFKSLIEANWKW